VASPRPRSAQPDAAKTLAPASNPIYGCAVPRRLFPKPPARGDVSQGGKIGHEIGLFAIPLDRHVLFMIQ